MCVAYARFVNAVAGAMEGHFAALRQLTCVDGGSQDCEDIHRVPPQGRDVPEEALHRPVTVLLGGRIPLAPRHLQFYMMDKLLQQGWHRWDGSTKF